MPESYGRDLDLNLLRVFLVVAETGSVTAAADRLYLTQPAVSAALRRLATAIGAPLFVRAGRGVELTARGQRLRSGVEPHLGAMVEATLTPATFTPATSDRVVRIGLSDSNEEWLLPSLLAALAKDAPNMRLVVLPVQFRTIRDALESGRVDVAVTIADELPASIARKPLFRGGFGCVYDPRHARLSRRGDTKKVSLETYLAHEHVIVSYNGDLRGVVEDALGMERSVRVSVPTFHNIGAVVEGTALLATLPEMVTRIVLGRHRALRRTALPFELGQSHMELLYRRALEDDGAIAFVRELVVRIARAEMRG